MNKQSYINNYINNLIKDTPSTSSYTNNAIGNQLSSFLDYINDENNIYYRTGINSIDDLLHGGLSPCTITVLGGVCGMGKTTMALQSAWFISTHYQKDVLFIACEMSEFQMQVKLISYLTSEIVQNNSLTTMPLTYDDIQDKKNWSNFTDEQTDLFLRAMDKLQDNNHLYIKSIVGKTSAEQIKEAIELHIQETGNVPIIFLDYLQNVREPGILNADKQVIDNAIYMLNAVAHAYKTPVVALSSLGRSAYDKPSLSSAKGSGEIEYSAANVLLLTPGETKPTPSRPSSRPSKREHIGTKVIVTLVKARFGAKDKVAELTFCGDYNVFLER